MGRKPVLGLVGLCLGLTLTGCKDCSCRGTSRKEVVTPVAKVNRTTTPAQADGSPRPAGTDTNSVWNKGGANALKPAHDYDASQYSPPAKTTASGEPADTMGGTPVSMPNHEVLRETDHKVETIKAPAPKEMLGGGPVKDETVEVSGQPIVIPPPAPMTSGKMGKDGLGSAPKMPETPVSQVPELVTPPTVVEQGSGPAPVQVTPPGKVESIPVPGSPSVPTPDFPTPVSGGSSVPDVAPAPAPDLNPPSPPGAMSEVPLLPPG